MDRAPHLIRDYGPALGLTLASAWVLWSGLMPQVEANHALDLTLHQQQMQNDARRAELERLEILRDSTTDPLSIERKARQYFGAEILPEGEIPVLRDAAETDGE